MAVNALNFGGLTIPPAAAINAAAAPRTLAGAGARALVPLTYGEDRVSALILNVVKHGSDATLVLVQCLWGRACNAVDTFRLNDQALPGTASITTYTGSQSTADATLVAAFAAQGITYGDTLAGYAYSVVSMKSADFDGQLNFSARVQGRKLYDPRLDSTNGGSGSHQLDTPSTWAYSTNPSLALADWLYSSLYGAGVSVLWSSVITAANANDALIGSPTETHRRIGVTFTAAVQAPDMAEALRAYAGVWLIPTSGGVKLLPDATAASVATYTHASGQIAAIDALTLRDLSSSPTAVEVVYTDTSQIPYRDASATAQRSGAGTTLPWRLSTVRLPGINRYGQALREATERLNKLYLSDLSTTLEVFDGGIAHEAGDVVTVTHPVGITSKLFRVSAVEMPGPGRWRLSLAEYDPAVYSTAVATAPTYTNAGLDISNGIPPAWTEVTGRPADNEIYTQQGLFSSTYAWDFNGVMSGWSTSGVTATNYAAYVELDSTGTDPQIWIESRSIPGAANPYIRARIKRTAGSGWDGTVFYSTAGHAFSGSYYKVVGDSTVTNEWKVIEWGMNALTVGGTDWTSNTITGIRLDLGATASDTFLIDWIEVGNYAAHVLADSVNTSQLASNAATDVLETTSSGPLTDSLGLGIVVTTTEPSTTVIARFTGVMACFNGTGSAKYVDCSARIWDGATASIRGFTKSMANGEEWTSAFTCEATFTYGPGTRTIYGWQVNGGSHTIDASATLMTNHIEIIKR